TVQFTLSLHDALPILSRWNASLCHDRPSFQNATHALPPCNSSCCSFIASRKLAMYNLLSQVAARKLPFRGFIPYYGAAALFARRSEEHTSQLQSRFDL